MTTDPNELVEPLDNRMPVILGSKDYDRWLAPVDAAHLPVDLLRPFPADRMTAWKVSRAVGNVKNDDPSLIAPIGSLTGNEEMLPPFQIMLPGSRFQKAVGGDG